MHYAEIFLEGDDVIDHMVDKGASLEVKDVVRLACTITWKRKTVVMVLVSIGMISQST